MGVFFDVALGCSDNFLSGVGLDNCTEVSKETDPHYTDISMSYATPSYIHHFIPSRFSFPIH